MKPVLTAQRLRETMHYDPETGVFTRLQFKRGKKCPGIGNPTGYTNAHGYQAVTVDAVKYIAHRLTFLYMLGRLPVDLVDHINGIRSDNRWINLREADATLNRQNIVVAQANSSTGLRGAFKGRNGKFRSQISSDGKLIYLGEFATAEDAAAAYAAAKTLYHPGTRTALSGAELCAV